MLGKLIREPFFHFLILGGVIYGGVHLARGSADQYRILVDQNEVQRIAATFAKQYGHPPTKDELGALIDRFIQEEIFYREGVALKLDEDDEIVRRRVAQKFEFLQQDLSIVDEPTEPRLRAYFELHKEKYLIPERLSFTHVYFSPDRDGLAGARLRASNTLETLQSDNRVRAPELGDRFPDLYDYASMGKPELEQLFGDPKFADDLFALPVGVWGGPFQSGYGWHLVRLTTKTAARLPDLTEVEEKVRIDYLEQARSEKDLETFEQLRKKYQVIEDDGQHG